MSDLVIAQGYKRGTTEQRALEVNERSELITAQGLPPSAEMARRGQGYTVMTATAFTPLVVVPSTLANLEIWNPGTNGMSYIIDSLFMFQLLGTAATQTHSIWACVTRPVAAGVAATLTVASWHGKASASVARAAVQTTMIANGWRPYGAPNVFSTAAATPGNAFEVPVGGRLVVPPTCSVAIAVVGSLATATSVHVGASWYEEIVTNL